MPVVSTGDSGSPGYPAYSPTVAAVSGTNLILRAAISYQGETACQ
jgi:hypothetical protein